MSRWETLRPESDRRKRKSPNDGLRWLEKFKTPEDEETDKHGGKRKKGRKETASRLKSTDA
ncbi:hypothetical protein M3557_04345 [Bhargavaea ginsengi]|uniref:hypothetical protein n=1 Tax=Bhargavaea ginsengi TaxID=426757 RepID=UPI0020405D1E|nr:hypothetical protein [Bhargavaea ginsengi]MCM3087138.1 hypothetical protein [Bhargavaea ginsengi]